jgi:hypothetical protein
MDKNLEIMTTELSKIKKDFFESIINYKNYIETCTLDAPIGVLCLPSKIENLLLDRGIYRVSELTALDLTKIKGLGVTRIGIILEALRKFRGM